MLLLYTILYIYYYIYGNSRTCSTRLHCTCKYVGMSRVTTLQSWSSQQTGKRTPATVSTVVVQLFNELKFLEARAAFNLFDLLKPSTNTASPFYV